uniref:Malonyl-CoA-acyl carrier protein transacylase n=1 Tax=Astatotilapia calliptera TaxID=8154 RepID=A0A3P8QSJ0_ASTCA
MRNSSCWHQWQSGWQHLPEGRSGRCPVPREPAAAPQRRPKKDPSGCSVLLFPSQGSQFVGMGRGLLKYPNVKEMFTVAQKILGYDLLSLCLEGPEDELQKTVHCQPAVFVTSLAAVERLNQENPKAIEMCVAAAGFSVGEFAALVFSGAMNFAEDRKISFLALYAVKVRAETMQKASELVPSGMLSVTGRPQAQYNYACLLQAKEHCKSLGMENPVCSLLLSFLLSSLTSQALDFLQENSRSLKFMRTKTLPVSGAFHTELMASATEPLREVLRQVEVSQPLYPKGINIFSETCIQLLCKATPNCSKMLTVIIKFTSLMIWKNGYDSPGKGDSGIGQFIPLCWCICLCSCVCVHR